MASVAGATRVYSYADSGSLPASKAEAVRIAVDIYSEIQEFMRRSAFTTASYSIRTENEVCILNVYGPDAKSVVQAVDQVVERMYASHNQQTHWIVKLAKRAWAWVWAAC